MPAQAAVLHPAITAPRRRPLHIALWVAQVLLLALFGAAGYFKLFTPIVELARTTPWVTDAPSLVRFIGIAELAGALGVILPALTRIKPILTPLAASGLVVVMVLATGFHITRGEFSAIGVPVTLAVLAGFVAWGRTVGAPIAARG